MKLFILIISILITSCSLIERKQRINGHNEIDQKTVLLEEEWETIKNEKNLSTLTVFIEKYPESAKIDSAITILFSVQNELLEKGEISLPPAWHCGRNCRQVHINQKGEFLFNLIPIPIDSLYDYSYTFISDTSFSEDYPEFNEYINESGELRTITKAKLEIVFIKDSVKNLQKGIILIRKAFETLKNDLSMKWHDIEHARLNHEKKDEIDSIFERRIIFTKLSDYPTKWRNNHFVNKTE